jgi:uncharacterized membrane protein YczE
VRLLFHARSWLSVFGVYVSGCVVFSTGAYLFIHSNLGTDPLDTFALGVLRHVPATIGLVQLAVAIVCLCVAAAVSRRRPILSPLFTFFFCGSIIDFERYLQWARLLPFDATAVLVAATVLCAYGSALIIMSGFGIRAIDLVAIEVRRKWRWPFWIGKGMVEGLLLGSGYALGGPAGMGTVFFLVGVDLLIQPLVWGNARFLNLRNRGLPARQHVALPLDGLPPAPGLHRPLPHNGERRAGGLPDPQG